MTNSPPVSSELSQPYPWLDMDPWDRACIREMRNIAQAEHGKRVEERQKVNGHTDR